MRMTLLSLSLLSAAVLFRMDAVAAMPLTADEAALKKMLSERKPGPEQQRLAAMASGECSAAECFDGRPILRREGRHFAILEEKKIGEVHVPGTRECETIHHGGYYYDGHYRAGHYHGGYYYGGYRHGDYGDPYHWDSSRCWSHPAHTISTFLQKVGIIDPDGYVSEAWSRGMGVGGLIGAAFGALGFLAGPVGFATLAAGALAGAAIGGKLASRAAKAQVPLFEREVNQTTYP